MLIRYALSLYFIATFAWPEIERAGAELHAVADALAALN